MDILITLVALGVVATISYVIYNRRKTNLDDVKEWTSHKQREEGYGKAVEALIKDGRWEDLEYLRTALEDYPHLIQRIEEALKNRKN